MQFIALDDEPGSLKLLVRAIARAQPEAQIESFQKVSDALEFARGTHVDVVFLDIEMPEMTGIEAAKCFGEIDEHINIVFTTGYSDFAMDAMKLHASGYLMKPVTASDVAKELSNLRHPISEAERELARLRVQTFGHFEVFCNGKPVAFKRSKSKELLAFLIDCQGASVNKREIAAALFGDDYTPQAQNYLTKIYRDLSDSLAVIGAEDVLVKGYNAYAIDSSKVDCDLYRYQAGDLQAGNAYNGEYMVQYGWAEGRLI